MHVIYQHPLAYLLGLQGTALLRAFNGGYDREFTLARFADIRELLDSADRFGDGAQTRRITSEEGYAAWSANYDEPNDLIDLEEPVVRRILSGIPAGQALDAACGTGRHASYLVAQGHRVIGVDSCAPMLSIACGKVPAAGFSLGNLTRLPLPDGELDLAVCSLALSHVADLAAAFAEFARVLRPGGHLVISDSRMDYALVQRLADGSYGCLPHYPRATSEYLTLALPLGFQVRHCEELRHPPFDPAQAPSPATRELPDHPSDFWALRPWYPAAARAASAGNPVLIFWHFQLRARTPQSSAAR